MRHTRRQAWGQMFRRGLALGMALVVIWLISLTADLDAAVQVMGALGARSALATASLQAQLWPLVPEEAGLEGLSPLQRMAVKRSAVLRSGRSAAARLRAEEDSPREVGAGDEDDGEAPISSTPPDSVTERTLGVSSSQHYDSAGGVYIYNRTGQEVDVAALAAAPVSVTLPEEGPQILIMHTHGTEAYTPDGADLYQASDPYRTTDSRYNVLRIGDEITAALEAAGFSVLHDTALYDYPSYSGAYDRSLAGVQALLEQYPTIRVVMDVHRDALVGEDDTIYKTAAALDAIDAAQVMLVMGSNDNGLPHDRWKENLTLAIRLQQQLNQDWPTLARPISLRSGRYNQQLTTGSILVEVGSHGNTLQEALAAARCFAASAAQLLQGLKE